METISDAAVYERGGKQKEIYRDEDVIHASCPLCNHNNNIKIYTERGALSIVRCRTCALIYVSPRLKNPESVYWGDAKSYYQEAKLVFENKAAHHRNRNYNEDLALIYQYKPEGNFLDVGSNLGFFLNSAKKWPKWNLFGVEPSPSLSELAIKYFGLNIKKAFLEDAGFESRFFDIVTMTDVFEHIVNPDKILHEIGRILKPNGVLFIKVPNGLFNLFKFQMAELTGKLKNYDIFDSYEHVVHYSGKTLRQMLKKNGFEPIKVTIGRPIHVPIWHKYVGYYYQYSCPWSFDFKRQSLRNIFWMLSKIEYYLRGKNIGYLAPNIVIVAKKFKDRKNEDYR